MEDKDMKKNVETVSKLFHDQKDDPLEKAIWWIEYVMLWLYGMWSSFAPKYSLLESVQNKGVDKTQSYDQQLFIENVRHNHPVIKQRKTKKYQRIFFFEFT